MVKPGLCYSVNRIITIFSPDRQIGYFLASPEGRFCLLETPLQLLAVEFASGNPIMTKLTLNLWQ
jgi:hypothetical protein